jgi:hypothetical protein
MESDTKLSGPQLSLFLKSHPKLREGACEIDVILVAGSPGSDARF